MNTQARAGHSLPQDFATWQASAVDREDRALRPVAASLLAVLVSFWATVIVHAVTAPMPGGATEIAALLAP